MQASSAPTQPTKTATVLDPNPIPHLIEGVKNMVRTNLKPLLATVFSSLIIPSVCIIALLVAMTKYTDAQLLWDAVRANFVLLAVVEALIVVASAFFWLALNRVILLGVRTQPTSFTSALGFSLGRVLPTLGVYVVISLALLLPTALIGLLMWQLSPWFGLLLLPMLVVYAAASFFLAPLGFVLAESRPLGGIVALLKHLLSLWKQGFLVLFVYVLCMNFVSGGLGSVGSTFWSLPSGSESSTSEFVRPNESFDKVILQDGTEVTQNENEDFSLDMIKFDIARWVVGIGGIVLLFIIAITTIMQSFLLAGFAHVYDTVDALQQKGTHAKLTT